MMATGGILGAAIAGAAAAQQQQQMTPPALTKARDFNLSLSSDVYYDTNIARGSKLLAQQRGLSQDDTVFDPSLKAELLQPLGTQMVFLSGTAGYVFHDKNTRLDRAQFEGSGGYVARVGICQPSFMGGYSSRQSELEDADNQTVKNRLEVTSTVAGLQCGRPIGPGLQLSVGRSQAKNSATQRVDADHDTRQASATLSYTHPTLGTAGVVWSYSDNQYPNRIFPGRPVGDGYLTTALGVSYQRQIGTKLKADVMFARTTAKREFAPPGIPLKFTSTTYAGNVDYRLGQRLDLQLHASRAVKPSNRPGKLYEIATQGEGVAAYDLGTRYHLELGYSVADNNANVDTLPGSRPVVTRSRNNIVRGSIEFKQSDRIDWQLDLRRDKRHTNLPQFNYNSIRVGLTTNVKF